MATNIVSGVVQAGAIAGLANQLSNLSHQIVTVGASVRDVSDKQVQTRAELLALIAEFREYVAVDAMHKELSIAETRIVKTRQEIDKRFGSYDEVRKRATGILRSVDVSVVRQETIRTATEELMLSSPTYWLAPALVALAAWIGDRQDLAERALAEALRRDDYKTSLLFALASRRARKSSAAAAWLDRYFRLQDPYALDREVAVLLDAVALGAFGTEASMVLTSGLSGWLDEVTSNAKFVEQERARWRDAFAGMKGKVSDSEFTTLSKYSPTWKTLRDSLAACRGHGVASSYLSGVLDGEIVAPASLEDRIDGILDRLVTDFDDEELELRRKERQLELIIHHNGDRVLAEQAYKVEAESLDEKSSFVAVLTSASLAQGGGTSRATQRLALALSKPWAMEAQDEHAATLRSQRPTRAAIAIDDWSAFVERGSDEDGLIKNAHAFLKTKEDIALKGLWAWHVWITGVLALGSFALHSLIIGCILAVLQVIIYVNRRGQAGKVRATFAQNRIAAESIIRASVAEWVDYGDAWREADLVASHVSGQLESLVPEQFFGANSKERKIA